jgi:hypothetical protein
MLSGTFRNPLTHKSNGIRGVILQNIAAGAGFYTSTNDGAFTLIRQ